MRVRHGHRGLQRVDFRGTSLISNQPLLGRYSGPVPRALRWSVAPSAHVLCVLLRRHPALEATQGQMDGLCSQLPYKCHLEEVASVGE